MLADLARSGITAADAKQFGFTPIIDMGNIDDHFAGHSAYAIPYRGVDGKPIIDPISKRPFVRYRLTPPDPAPDDPPPTTKPRGYIQIENTVPHPYIPPIRNKLDLAVRAQDSSIPVIICEGEKKSVTATLAERFAIGIGGVHAWRSARHKRTIVHFFTGIAMENRDAFMVFDSDLAFKAQVAEGLYDFARALYQDLGARPYIVFLPDEGDDKTGLDDFLVRRGGPTAPAAQEALADLLSHATLFAELDAIVKFNKRFTFVVKPAGIYDAQQHTILTINHWQQMTLPEVVVRYVPPTAAALKRDANAPPKPKKVQVSDEWMRFRGRSIAPTVAYDPRYGERLPDGSINYWRPPPFGPKKMTPGERELWNRFSKYQHQKEPGMQHYADQLLAYPLVHPGVKLAVAIAFVGVAQGTGKTMRGHLIGSAYGGVALGDDHRGHNFGVCEAGEVYSNFTPPGQLFVQCCLIDEAFSTDKLGDTDKLKGMITRQSMMINQKNIQAFSIRDCINYILTSNHPDALRLDNSDRRFFIVDSNYDPLPQSVYGDLGNWMAEGRSGPSLLWWAQQVDLSGFNPYAAAPMTKAKEEMQELSKTEVQRWVRGIAPRSTGHLGSL